MNEIVFLPFSFLGLSRGQGLLSSFKLSGQPDDVLALLQLEGLHYRIGAGVGTICPNPLQLPSPHRADRRRLQRVRSRRVYCIGPLHCQMKSSNRRRRGRWLREFSLRRHHSARIVLVTGRRIEVDVTQDPASHGGRWDPLAARGPCGGARPHQAAFYLPGIPG